MTRLDLLFHHPKSFCKLWPMNFLLTFNFVKEMSRFFLYEPCRQSAPVVVATLSRFSAIKDFRVASASPTNTHKLSPRSPWSLAQGKNIRVLEKWLLSGHRVKRVTTDIWPECLSTFSTFDQQYCDEKGTVQHFGKLPKLVCQNHKEII